MSGKKTPSRAVKKTKTNGASASNGAAPKSASNLSLGIKKTYKMYVGGAFIRSESGRYFQVSGITGDSEGVENIPRGSRKDARDAVLAAHAAFGGWSKRIAANRGQILYRLAEVLDARRDELVKQLVLGGLKKDAAEREVSATIDRTVAYAGWTDKYQSLFSSLNPVGGPHFDFTLPEPMGLVTIVAPSRPALLGLVSSILPVIVGGNTCVVLASEADPRTAITFSECLATSDLPGGVVNILTGQVAEMLPHLARHMEVNALDLHGVDVALGKEVEVLAADSVKRVRNRSLSEATWFDAEACESPRWIERFVEMKTIWHPSGG